MLIEQSALDLAPTEKPQLVGILRHELGHTLGFRCHERTRPSAGKCFEDSSWTVLTEYDPYSEMHYPQCNGKGEWSLDLTARERSGAACAYGPAAGFTVDTNLVVGTCHQPQPQPSGTPKKETLTAQRVAKDAQKDYGPFPAVAGTLFDASMKGGTGAGDADLYVRFGMRPGLIRYDCRPFLLGPKESCAVTVPPGTTQAHVMVHGYTAGRYDLTVTHVPPTPWYLPPQRRQILSWMEKRGGTGRAVLVPSRSVTGLRRSVLSHTSSTRCATRSVRTRSGLRSSANPPTASGDVSTFSDVSTVWAAWTAGSSTVSTLSPGSRDLGHLRRLDQG